MKLYQNSGNHFTDWIVSSVTGRMKAIFLIKLKNERDYLAGSGKTLSAFLPQ